jgi:AraC-like DNA-binding protein
MLNNYEWIKNGLHFKKFEVGELIVVEYKCPLEVDSVAIWAKHDYIIHVLSGKKTWRNLDGVWTAEQGETLYIKKGASIIHQIFDEDFCMLGFFITDDIIREVVKEVRGKTPIQSIEEARSQKISKLVSNPVLSGFYQSMLMHFRSDTKPVDSLLELKIKELIMTIINLNDNPDLTAYFNSVSQSSGPSLSHIMELNYHYNLTLNEFAELCHRSLSSFKRDFKSHYNSTPGKWLLSKRLDLAANLLKTSDSNVSQIAFECGFEDLSHFSRTFKDKFGTNPSEFKIVG